MTEQRSGEFNPEDIFSQIISSGSKEKPKDTPQESEASPMVGSSGGGFRNRNNEAMNELAGKLNTGPTIDKHILDNEIRPMVENLIKKCDELGVTALFAAHTPVSTPDEMRVMYCTGREKPPEHLIEAMKLVSKPFKESIEKFRAENPDA